ncbi:PREDICTED: nuclear autoantigen Sp-100-like isoform X5 [Brassica oleracea var. oleracea]|uniref:Uncharacterized protein n=1 Tax=Brassica oleracea var. oleracea TaxID=109376 RepID=A0A0D3BGQ1_BRAOL|nr:PREDICTED: nuclear autoantigen Sp-100-like isoform X5 [Brassica oleracea var. oleracea]
MSLTSSVSYPLCAKHLFANSHAHPLFSLSDRLYLLILPSSPIKQTDLPLVSKFPSDMKKSNEKGKAKTTKEALKLVDDKKVGKRKAPAEKPSKQEKKAKKDPNKPKRAPSAFFVFLPKMYGVVGVVT